MKSKPSSWNEGSLVLRFAYMLLFTLLFGFAELFVLALLIIQGFSVIVGGAPNPGMQRLSASVGEYLRQIVTYIGCQSQVKPWPLAAWPGAPVATDSAGRGSHNA